MKNNNNPQLVAVGKRIRSLREDMGVTQEDFARITGLDRSYYGGVERGERNISVLNLVRIAIAFNKDVGDLFPTINDLKTLSVGK